MDEKAQSNLEARLNVRGDWRVEIPLQRPGLALSEEDVKLALRIANILGSSLEVVGHSEAKVGVFLQTNIMPPPHKTTVGVRIFLDEGARLCWVDRRREEIVEGRFRIDYGDRGPTVVISVVQVATGD